MSVDEASRSAVSPAVTGPPASPRFVEGTKLAMNTVPHEDFGHYEFLDWIQSDAAKGRFAILRLYSPLQSFFDKAWRPDEIELTR